MSFSPNCRNESPIIIFIENYKKKKKKKEKRDFYANETYFKKYLEIGKTDWIRSIKTLICH